MLLVPLNEESEVGKFLTTDGNIDMVTIPVFGVITMQMSHYDIERLWGNIDKGGESVCWPWTGSKNNYGYGHISIQGKLLLAHRVVFFLINGGLSADLEILHKCSNPACCNPWHLSQDTHKANMQQAAREKRWPKRGGPGAYLGLTEEIKQQIRTSPLSARALERLTQISYKTIVAIRKELQVCQQESSQPQV